MLNHQEYFDTILHTNRCQLDLGCGHANCILIDQC